MLVAQSATQVDGAQSGLFAPDAGQAAAKFLEAGLTLLESLCPPRSADGIGPIERGLSALLRTDAQTRRSTLEIPLPESVSAERLAKVISGFLGKLVRPS
jgi:hypothetical protein